MLKSWASRLSLMLTVILLLLVFMPAVAFAGDYVALGDSISYGLTDPVFDANGTVIGYQGYTHYFHQNFVPRFSYTNLSMPGHTSASLIDVIGSRDNSRTIRNGDVFTISIGSNNLLGPAIAAILGLYGIDMEDPKYDNDLNGALMIQDLAVAVAYDWTDGGTTPAERFSLLLDPLQPAARQLNTAWAAGTALFNLHWPVIMTRLRMRAPFARIYVNSLYNPLLPSLYSQGRYSMDFSWLYARLEWYMHQINTVIGKGANVFRYKVADVHGAFATADYSGSDAPLTFNIPGAISLAETGFTSGPSSRYAFFLACDPHPTKAGHVLIYNQLASMVK